MFNDPIPLPTIDTVVWKTQVPMLPRTGASLNFGQYTQTDGTSKFTIQHAYNKRVRRTFRLDSRLIAPDPLLPATNVEQSMSVYVVVDIPRTGISLTKQIEAASALLSWPVDNSWANLTRFMGGES